MEFNRRIFFLTLLLLLFVVAGPLFSQQKKLYTVKEIQTLIEQDSLTKAQKEISKNIAFYRTEKIFDSLYNYIQFQGSFKLNNGNKAQAISQAETLLKEITKNSMIWNG